MVRRYDRVRHISTGRFGPTVLVKDSDGRLSAMKSIDIGRLPSSERTELLQEVLQLARLRHPNLLASTESFLHQGKLCIVSEYAEGGTVAGQIDQARRGGFFTLQRNQALQYFSEALLALCYLHERQVIHRDLRSRRLLLSQTGHVILSGMALSVFVKTALVPERPDIDAMAYLSPELLAGLEEHSFASDMWALGIVMYEMLILKRPFQHSHPRSLLESIVAGPIPPLPESLSPELPNLCMALLRKAPSSRASAAESLAQPAVQSRLVSLLEQPDDEPPGRFAVIPSKWQIGTATPRQSLGPPALNSKKEIPRALRSVGEAFNQTGLLATPRATFTRPVELASFPASPVRAKAQIPSTPEISAVAQAELVLSTKAMLEEMPLTGN
mmetsp:Transcript_97757/g.174162  ORF Transcript_97757/g.174162 Transcript_97757/m.174162 type:complete len:385 (+) Transcript_97757:86-1240(+)